MEPFLNHVAAILSRHPAPAMSLGELIAHLRDDVPGVVPGETALLRALQGAGGRFTVVAAAPGERSLGRLLGDAEGGGDATPTNGAQRGPWILCTDPRPVRTPFRSHHLVRETVAHLGHGLDRHSARSLVRWLALLEECGRIGRRLRDAADSG